MPWSVIVGKLLIRKDIRGVGDGNPGTANAWKSGGWVPGIFCLILDTAKSYLPVYLATHQLVQTSEHTPQTGLALVALAPIVGHGWSPFLKFKGGKALAASWGSWIAITGGAALPVALALLLPAQCLQKNHAVSITFCLMGLLVIFSAQQYQSFIALFWVANMAVIAHKHWTEYGDGILVRDWVGKLGGKFA